MTRGIEEALHEKCFSAENQKKSLCLSTSLELKWESYLRKPVRVHQKLKVTVRFR